MTSLWFACMVPFSPDSFVDDFNSLFVSNLLTQVNGIPLVPFTFLFPQGLQLHSVVSLGFFQTDALFFPWGIFFPFSDFFN